ncbi:short-chain dehydrogenase [Haladaptatus sp. W1]|uniref:SDR family NAD(P)-dependent oxidoreductase n=1 Tax=Haladaptatus sp. W1 TaxID=1897478 RepID=UPI000849C1B2|nr:SDR family oxidoreductase [Haladaptatus sp. W1]ODR80370.1 short-chain dehydrogenase [Haladaptatus sp. W1]
MTECNSVRHADHIAIVTGSTKGIGAGIARRLACEGATVVITGRSAEEGKAVVESIRSEGGEAMFIEADMRNPAEIEALIEQTADRFGRIDVLVNNAGVQTETTATDATIDDWEFVLETDFRSFWLCVKYAVEHMPAGSAILNMSSNHAYLTMPGLFPYNAVKAGINGMTRALALELGPLEIRVNTINPGWVEVDRTQEELTADERERVEEMHPMGRIGTPEDVATASAFLTSEEAAFITGTSLLVDGGRTAVMQDHTFVEYKRNL